MTSKITLCAVGDVFVDRPHPASLFQAVAPLMQQAHLRFGNCEGVYSPTPSRPPSAGAVMITDPRNAAILGEVGFDVMSCANNHFVDGGHLAMLETLDHLHSLGILTTGAGANLEEARKPARLDRNGVALEVLAYSCVHPIGYNARENVPGVASLRVLTTYYADPMFWNPGAQPNIATAATSSAVEMLRTDVESARRRADIVIVSFHWGESSRPVKLQDYEMQLGRAAVDAGADLVLGHHHHCLRGVELYRGRPILYGLASFAFDFPDVERQFSDEARRTMRERHGDYAFGPREGYPTFPFHPEYRRTVLALISLSPGERPDVTLVPCVVRPEGQPEPLRRDSDEASQWLRYLTDITSTEGFTTRFDAKELAFDRTIASVTVAGPDA